MINRIIVLLTLLYGVLLGVNAQGNSVETISHALEITTSQAQANIWDWQIHRRLSAPLTVGKTYRLTIVPRASIAAASRQPCFAYGLPLPFRLTGRDFGGKRLYQICALCTTIFTSPRRRALLRLSPSAA